MISRLAIAAIAMLTTIAPALAHLDPAHNGSLLAGVSHPLFGLDHVLVMVAVGLWAAAIGGSRVWIVPAAFVATMTAGYGLALIGLGLPLVEPTILASLVVLGLLVAATIRLPIAAGALLVGLFALFHGHAHGGELGGAAALPFALGFVLATTLLHAAGIGLGLAFGSGRGLAVTRFLGAATAAAGIGLAFGG